MQCDKKTIARLDLGFIRGPFARRGDVYQIGKYEFLVVVSEK
jgi:hypothetical protein